MAVEIDYTNSSVEGPTSGTSTSWSHTITSDTDALIVFVGRWRSGGNTVSSVTYNSTNLTEAAEAVNIDDEGTSVWVLESADLPSSGSYTIEVTYNLSGEHQHSAVNVEGCHLTNPYSNTASDTGNSNNPNVTITSDTDEIVVGSAAWWNRTRTLGTEDTQIEYLENGNGNDTHLSWANDGASSVDFDVDISSSAYWAIAAISLQPPVEALTINVSDSFISSEALD